MTVAGRVKLYRIRARFWWMGELRDAAGAAPGRGPGRTGGRDRGFRQRGPGAEEARAINTAIGDRNEALSSSVIYQRLGRGPAS